MASLKTIQADTMASIDTAKALTDKVLSILTIMLESPSLSLTFATNPIGYLLQLLEHLGVTYEELQEFLTKLLIYIIPALEISVKAILLTNLKKMISCSIDPRIPEQYRKRHVTPTDQNTVNRYGIEINIESIDLLDKLSTNPLSDEGRDMYFGLQNVDDVYKFARADDFDAFLWFVMHKGKFPNSSNISVDNTTFNDPIHGLGNEGIEAVVTPASGTLLSALEITIPQNTSAKRKSSTILPGNTFRYSGASPNVISMCIDAQRNEKNEIISNTLVPVSDDWASVNWYIRRADQLGKNLGFGWHYDKDSKTVNSNKQSRDFSKERAICNLQYMGIVDEAPITGLVNNKIRFTILPKPLIHIPDLAQGEPPWRFKRMLFNAQGDYDANGKYTLADISDSQDLTYLGGAITIEPKSGKVTVNNKEEVVKNLIECYPGLTVYEFNYDYVMGLKLFDAKVLATTLIDSVVNMRMGITLGLDARHQEATEELKQIIKSIINTDDSEINDCFFTFDNSKYDALLQKTQEKKAKQQKFGNVTRDSGLFNSVSEILAEYDTKTELHEQMDVLHRAITQAAVTISEGSDEKDQYGIKYAFVFDLIENLVLAIVNAILSPKVMMLLEVNQQLMGGTWEKITFKDIIVAMRSIIVAIINEVKDLIIQELLKFLLDKLRPIIEMLSSLIVRERLDDIAEAMAEIIRNCPVIWFKFGNQNLETKLDTVDYADIDVSSNKNGEQPSTNKC